MCGRYAAKNPDEIRRRFPAFDFKETFTPRYNVAPTQNVMIVKNDGSNTVALARWGLIPGWAKSIESQKIQPINAKMETIADSRMFAPLLRRRRCVLFADGFFEWQTDGRRKTPYFFQRIDQAPFAFAGLWDTWREEVTSCLLITGEPNALVAPIHNRMPVMLDPDDAQKWVRESDADPLELFALLRPYPPELMMAYPVTSAMNKASYAEADAVAPAEIID